MLLLKGNLNLNWILLFSLMAVVEHRAISSDVASKKQLRVILPGYDKSFGVPPHTPGWGLDNSFEVRIYSAANWTSTSITGVKMESSEAFMRLFDYIQGENKQQTKMPMTVPVTIRFETSSCAFCNQTYVMSFYLPKAFQESPPDPTDPMLAKEPRNKMMVYVRTFDGYAHQTEYQENAIKLYSDLLRHGVTADMVVKDSYFGASYDSPFHFWARRNEVWILGSK